MVEKKIPEVMRQDARSGIDQKVEPKKEKRRRKDGRQEMAVCLALERPLHWQSWKTARKSRKLDPSKEIQKKVGEGAAQKCANSTTSPVQQREAHHV